MAKTYEPIGTATASGSQSVISFTSISGSYTDLIVAYSVKDGTAGNEGNILVTFNSDTATNYSWTNIYGNGTAAGSSRSLSQTAIYAYCAGNTASFDAGFFHVMNYANATTYKCTLNRGNVAAGAVVARAGLWRSTAAITRMDLTSSSGNYASGSTFTLYGIKAA
jgi:hypothetical protein